MSIIEKNIGIWIVKEQVKPEVDAEFRFLDTNKRLGLGENEAIKLCKQLNVEYLVVDDKEARRVSKILSIKPIGTCAMIIQAYRRGSITKREAFQILDESVKGGFRTGSAVYRRVLDELGLS